MDGHNLIKAVRSHLNEANVAYCLCNYDEYFEHLCYAYDLLDDEVGSKARDKYESAESSET